MNFLPMPLPKREKKAITHRLIEHRDDDIAFEILSYPIQLLVLKPNFSKPRTKSFDATLERGIISSILRSNFLSMKASNSSEFRAPAHTDTVTPRMKQALAVPSPIANH